MRRVYEFVQQLRKRKAQAKARPRTGGAAKQGVAAEQVAPDSQAGRVGPPPSLELWSELVGSGAVGEVSSGSDFDAFRKRYREIEFEIDKPPHSVRKIEPEPPAAPLTRYRGRGGGHNTMG